MFVIGWRSFAIKHDDYKNKIITITMAQLLGGNQTILAELSTFPASRYVENKLYYKFKVVFINLPSLNSKIGEGQN